LGGNRVGLFRQYFNLILVFFLCGLWHQASWNCIIWGLFHGSFLVLERFNFYRKNLEKLPKIIQNFYMLFLVMIGWIFFRSIDLASSINLLKIIAFDNPIQQMPINIIKILNSHFLLMSFIFAIMGYSPLIKNLSKSLIKKNKIFIVIFDLILLILFLISVIRLSSQTYNPFIYFQF
jgi:alginate O-acetyltransferase complex protein AlgI